MAGRYPDYMFTGWFDCDVMSIRNHHGKGQFHGFGN